MRVPASPAPSARREWMDKIVRRVASRRVASRVSTTAFVRTFVPPRPSVRTFVRFDSNRSNGGLARVVVSRAEATRRRRDGRGETPTARPSVLDLSVYIYTYWSKY